MESRTIDHNGVKCLQLIIPLDEPRPSKSGKTILLASTGGFITTTVKDQGRPVKVSFNVTRDKTDAEAGA